jgi:hypothetical protein
MSWSNLLSRRAPSVVLLGKKPERSAHKGASRACGVGAMGL